MENNVEITEDMIFSLGFVPIGISKEWPNTQVYKKGDYTLQYIHPWGQGNMDEGWMLKKNDVRITDNYLSYQEELKTLLR